MLETVRIRVLHETNHRYSSQHATVLVLYKISTPGTKNDFKMLKMVTIRKGLFKMSRSKDMRDTLYGHVMSCPVIAMK